MAPCWRRGVTLLCGVAWAVPFWRALAADGEARRSFAGRDYDA